MSEKAVALLTKEQTISCLTEGYLYIICECGRELMIWPNLSETTHHVPMTKECKKYRLRIKANVEIFDYQPLSQNGPQSTFLD